MDRRWYRAGADVCREQFEQMVVFDPPTGETHFLSELPLILLTTIGSESRGLGEVAARLDVQLDGDSKIRVLDALYQLQQAGLVESSTQ